MRLRNFVLWAVCLLTGAVSPPPVLAFNAGGFWSGMSRAQMAASAARQGLLISNGENGDLRVSAPGVPGLEASLGFCGNVLTFYRRNISSDGDYTAMLAHVFSDYGPPRAMSFRGDISTDMGSGSGVMQSYVITRWQRDNDRVELKSYFDWRIQQGNLGRFQPATLLYEMRNPCAVR